MNRTPAFVLLLLFSLLLNSSCYRVMRSRIDTTVMSRMLVGDPGLSNAEYARRLSADGWPVYLLNTASDANYLDDDEKNLILAHNLVRYNPKKFAELYVTEYLAYFRGNEFHYPGLRKILLTREGENPAIELYYQLLRTEPMGLLYPTPGLHQSARLYMDYLIENDARGHDGLGGIDARVSQFGFWKIKIGENITYGNFSAHDALIFLLIDDNVRNRSHRKVILLPDFRYLGVAKGIHPSFPTGHSFVINYADYFTEHQ